MRISLHSIATTVTHYGELLVLVLVRELVDSSVSYYPGYGGLPVNK